MDRFGVFVDAGYLFAEAGKLLFGVKERKRLILAFESFHSDLLGLARKRCGSEHLRTYWYDGARDAVPTPQQAELAERPGVKLRLGKLTAYGQKGVDSRIVRDLIILATERGITTAFLLGGDEDLREGVSEAQERGVRVVLVGIEPLDEQNLSPSLVMEADDLAVLNKDFLQAHFRLRDPEITEVVEPENPHDPRELGRAFGARWIEDASPQQRAEVSRGRAQGIPYDLDRQLLSYARRSLAISHIDDLSRSQLREGFWEAMDAAGPERVE